MNFKQPIISITFDDGWKNHYTTAVPILDRYGFKATFYVITRMSNRMLREGEGRMIPEDWKLLVQSGHEIGAHSQTHPHLRWCFPNKVKDEVYGSKEDLQNLGISAKTFAYPYGGHNRLIERYVRKAGYIAARLYDDRFVSKGNPFRVSSKRVLTTTSFEKIQSWIRNAKRNNLWLVLTLHQIQNDPPLWGSTPELLDKVCQCIVQEEISVVTVQDMVQQYYE